MTTEYPRLDTFNDFVKNVNNKFDQNDDDHMTFTSNIRDGKDRMADLLRKYEDLKHKAPAITQGNHISLFKRSAENSSSNLKLGSGLDSDQS